MENDRIFLKNCRKTLASGDSLLIYSQHDLLVLAEKLIKEVSEFDRKLKEAFQDGKDFGMDRMARGLS